MDSVTDLKVLLASQFPLLMVETQEEPRFLSIVRQVAEQLGIPVWVWSATTGLARDGGEAMYGTTDPHHALSFIDEVRSPSVFVFMDAHPILRNDTIVRRVKEVAQRAVPRQTVVFTAPSHEVPETLHSLAHVWELRPPGREELTRLLERTLAAFTLAGIPVRLTSGERGRMVDALTGLTLAEAERLLRRAASDDGVVDGADLSKLQLAKAAMFTADGILELVESTDTAFAEVGGMAQLKDWLTVRGRARMSGAPEMGIDPPRGVLLTGIPGCGKSLIAKTIAADWGLPLVLLDPSRLYGKYIGESESRLARALGSVDAMAPAVLWIDEIEKGFATSGEGDGGVSRRLLGTFLRWMQDRPDGVFLVATANNVASLPPELLRKGRFDEIFFVDLPNDAARQAILELHLRSRGWDPNDFEIAALSRRAEGFSGAELEAAIVGALYRAFTADAPLTTDRITAEIEATVPLSRARAEDIAALRLWAAERAVVA